MGEVVYPIDAWAKDPIQRLCNSCGFVKPLELFYNQVKGKYGKRSICKDCSNAATKKSRAAKKERDNDSTRFHKS